ncbi:hypothetical protein [Streptomyces sp. NPDC001652]|uniref:hypothetical protein n=1 Tax=Streptomyces sp. NPDC001652 TaxID=3154393 RepID=UPI0033273785
MRMHRVGKTLAALVAAGGLLGTAGYVVVGSSAGDLLFGYGCGDAEERLGEVLAAESVLEVPPDGSRGGESYQECDDDDRFVVAGRSYAYEGSPQSAIQHYRDRASAQGWRAVAGDCFAKSVGDTTGYLTVWGPDEGTLQVEITADREDSRWCE